MKHYQKLPKLSQTNHKFRDFCKLIQTKPLLIEAKQFLKLTIKDKNHYREILKEIFSKESSRK